MPPLEFTTIPLQDFGAGIDQLSSENSIAEGFSESIVNGDPNPKGYLAKRRGYQGYAGYVPLRVTKIEYTEDATRNLKLFFDSSVDVSSIDFSRIRNTPLIVAGRTSALNEDDAGDFPQGVTTYKYFPSFSSSIKRTVAIGTNTISIDASAHGFDSDKLLVYVYKSTSSINNDNEQIYANSITIDSATYEVEIELINNDVAFDAFIIIQQVVPTSGTNYISGIETVAAGDEDTFTITAATHQLASLSVIATCFQDLGSSLLQVDPQAVLLKPNGDVDVTLANGSGASVDYLIILTRVPVTNTVNAVVPAGTSADISVPGIGEDFVLLSCYQEDLGTGNLELVKPNLVTMNTDTQEATVSVINGTTSDVNFSIYWKGGRITANQLALDATVLGAGEAFIDTAPQLTVWGFSHQDLYGSFPIGDAPGWINHLDSYRSAGEGKVITGLGGNLFSAQGIDEVPSALIPTHYPALNGRVDDQVFVGPCFINTGDSSQRSRGYLEFDAAGEGETAQVTSILYEASSGNTKYLVSFPNLQVQGTLSTIISSVENLEDLLTVTQAGYEKNNGEFKIVAVTQPTATTLEFEVKNEERDSTDFDESSTGAECAILTNLVSLSSASAFIPGDILVSELFTEEVTVVASSSVSMILKGIEGTGSIPAGLRLVGQRTSRIIPLREFTGTRTVENVVAGDSMQIGSYLRGIKVLRVFAHADRAVTIVGDGTTAVVTLGSGDTSTLALGQWIQLNQAGLFSAQQQIIAINSDLEFEFASSVDDTATGVLVGNAVEIDENLLWEDTLDSSSAAEVTKRWIPIEIPETTGGIPTKTVISHFPTSSYANQKPIRSSMVSDNLYLTNREDDVLKYDGTSIYHAGLPRWQAQLYATLDTAPAAGGVISYPIVSSTVVAVTGSRVEVAYGEELRFAQGSTIKHSQDGAVYQVTGVSQSAADDKGFVYVDRAISGSGSGTIQIQAFVKYYFRLNAVDANGNVIASAITGSEDFRIDLAAQVQIQIKGVSLPPFGYLDYDRLEVEIYRTKVGQVAPFYRCTTIPLLFDGINSYFIYKDALSDDSFAYTENLDKVSSVLMGQELGTTWSRPLRARTLTSAGNRLVLSNVSSFPQIDLRFVDTGTRITGALLAGKILTLRKDSTSNGTTTDMLNVARYEVKTSGQVTIDPTTDVTIGTNTFTVTEVGHGLSVGNWIYFFHSAIADGKSLALAGHFQVSTVPTADTFTVKTSIPSGYSVSADDVDRYVVATTKTDIPVWMGTDGNYAQRNGQRVSPGSRSTVDSTGPNEFIYGVRLANAINSSMRAVDYTLSSNLGFIPWITAASGSEYALGQIILSQPINSGTPFEALLWAPVGYEIFANSYKLPSTYTIGSEVFRFPSRVLASFENYPEIMDNPLAVVDSQSRSAIDVNPADGQEINICVPFFGDSAFGGATQGSVLVAFKDNSIYLIDLAAKAAGNNAVQKIESRGIGCTAPASVTVTKDGLLFANESGIYKLTHQLKVEEQGRYLYRLWRDTVNKDRMDLLCAHNYPRESLYKLSYPAVGEDANSRVVAYNATREYSQQGMGSWTTYDNHPATVWCSLNDASFFGSTRGEVFNVRALNEPSDYRDDASPVSLEWTSRPMDFGDSGIRKAVYCIIVHYRQLGQMLSTKIYTAVDLRTDFAETDQAVVVQGQGDLDLYKVLSVRYAINDRKGVYLQFKLTNDGLDESVEITKIDVRVAGMTHRGTLEAKTVSRISG